MCFHLIMPNTKCIVFPAATNLLMQAPRYAFILGMSQRTDFPATNFSDRLRDVPSYTANYKAHRFSCPLSRKLAPHG